MKKKRWPKNKKKLAHRIKAIWRKIPIAHFPSGNWEWTGDNKNEKTDKH